MRERTAVALERHFARRITLLLAADLVDSLHPLLLDIKRSARGSAATTSKSSCSVTAPTATPPRPMRPIRGVGPLTAPTAIHAACVTPAPPACSSAYGRSDTIPEKEVRN